MAAAALLLSGCGELLKSKSELEDDAVAKAEKMMPGEYEITTRFKDFDIPGVTMEQQELLNYAKSKAIPRQRYCLTQKRAAEGSFAMADQVAATRGVCTPTGGEIDSSNLLSASYECSAYSGGTGAKGPPLTAIMDGRVYDTGATLSMRVDMVDATLPKGRATMITAVDVSRVGECRPATRAAAENRTAPVVTTGIDRSAEQKSATGR